MKILILGPKKYIGRHFSTIESFYEGKLFYEDSYNVNKMISLHPDLVILPDEHWCELGNIAATLKENNILVLQVMDGILEWRRTWDYTRDNRRIDGVINPLNQPAFAHKIACLGYRDFRILESWGNFGKCEIVGMPRLKHIMDIRRDFSHLQDKKGRILVCTAKTPAFTSEQKEKTLRSLFDLKEYFAGRKDIQVIWRLSGQLYEEIGVENTMNDLSGLEIHKIIQEVDSVITTPSTTLLEAMVLKTPVALLDYHNLPHYFDAAWNISAPTHVKSVIEELIHPPILKLEYQDFLLNEQLFMKEDPAERLKTLIEKMMLFKDDPDNIPAGLLDNYYMPNLVFRNDIDSYYPGLAWVAKMHKRDLELQLAAARGTIETLENKIQKLESKLNSIPFYNLLRKIYKKIKIK